MLELLLVLAFLFIIGLLAYTVFIGNGDGGNGSHY